MMMQIVHACGHVVPLEINGPWDARMKKKAALEKISCAICQSKGTGVSLSELKRINKEKAEAWGLLPLKGTEKQQSWANDVRVSLIEGLIENRIAPDAAIAAVVNERLDAAHWIKNKDDVVRTINFCVLLRKVKEIGFEPGSLCWDLAGAMGFGLPLPPKKRGPRKHDEPEEGEQACDEELD